MHWDSSNADTRPFYYVRTGEEINLVKYHRRIMKLQSVKRDSRLGCIVCAWSKGVIVRGITDGRE